MITTPPTPVPQAWLSHSRPQPCSNLVGASSYDNHARQFMNELADRLVHSEYVNEDIRNRANSTHLPARGVHELCPSSQDARINVFDQEPYKSAAQANHRFETALGKALSTSEELCSIAKRIREITGAPMTMRDFPQADRDKIEAESSFIGGAKELMDDIDNLDAHVMATLVKAEREEYSFAQPEAPAEGVDYLNFEVADRRKCMFNVVADKTNPMFPWNSHRFDLEIYTIKDPVQCPNRIKHIIADRWNAFISRQPDPGKYVRETLGLLQHNEKSGILDILQSVDESTRKTLLDDTLHVSWSTETNIGDERNHRGSNPLGPEFRQHKTGARSNVVRFSDKQHRIINQWVTRAIVHGKPVVSGPSGHTLRYLNHYAMCKEMHALSKVDVSGFPSLEEARLVMLGNLLSPKNHHSYHEIMLASIGVAENDHDMLRYVSPGSYADLEFTALGRALAGQARTSLNNH